ncbi:glucose-6-phosphate isomerase [Candidatus Saccharibacteria bacterium]|nr:glucose-6-phosphate isomerase [Candidatus Saccharibacteria bacterium]
MIELNFSPKVDEAKLKEILGEIKSDEMAGWVELPFKPKLDEIVKIKEAAEKINKESEIVVCIGIGGSYLGHRAIIEALRPIGGPEFVYAGNSLSKRELDYALKKVGDGDFSVIVISKSGTTLEPAKAFEAFKKKLADRYGVVGAIKRIYAITDAHKGALYDEAKRDNYTRFVIPDNVGGRYSVLSPVGLLPMAVAGVDIDSLLMGAETVAKEFEDKEDEEKKESEEKKEDELGDTKKPAETKPVPAAAKYAFMRQLLYSKGFDTEVFASFEPATMYFNEWLKQLFGESEGKNKQGIFPASVIYSTDLHSMGQFMQDGRRNLYETIIDYPTDDLNAKVVEAVRIAHTAGRIPVLNIKVPTYDAKGFGELIYFFEMACAISAKIAGVNPFDQPGVEEYKNELHKLMEKK